VAELPEEWQAWVDTEMELDVRGEEAVSVPGIERMF